MALPKIDSPKYELTLPLSKKRIKYRPFNVKEQRNLLMAMEAEDEETIQQNILDILESCTITENVNVETLPVIDIEYYFINLRAKSVGEIVDARYKCNNKMDDGSVCGNTMETKINLNEIKIEQEEQINPEIQLTQDFVVKLRYPDYSIVKNSFKYDNVNELTFNIIAQSVEYIYDGEQFYYSSEVEQSEILEFLESLSQEQFTRIEKFFNNLPKLSKSIKLKCSKCGYEHDIKVEGLESFFV